MEGITGPGPLAPKAPEPDSTGSTDRRWPPSLHIHRLYLGAFALCLVFACRSGKRVPLDPDIPAAAAPTPAWIHQPLSWEKLNAIATWLDGTGHRHDPAFVIEGELQLNEGRVLFTDRDLRSDDIQPELLRARAQAALSGFERVLANPAASTLQIQRAETGRRAAQTLLDADPIGVRVYSGPQVVPRSAWGAKPARPSRMTPSSGWNRITVHHSAEPNSPLSPSALSDSTNSIRLIQKYHMEDPGHRWGDIGYHFLIDSSGRVFAGRDLAWQGAHAGGSNNRGNIGICLLGDFSRGSPPSAAKSALELLIEELRAGHGIPRSQVFAHNHFGGTACPGPALTSFVRRFR